MVIFRGIIVAGDQLWKIFGSLEKEHLAALDSEQFELLKAFMTLWLVVTMSDLVS